MCMGVCMWEGMGGKKGIKGIGMCVGGDVYGRGCVWEGMCVGGDGEGRRGSIPGTKQKRHEEKRRVDRGVSDVIESKEKNRRDDLMVD